MSPHSFIWYARDWPGHAKLQYAYVPRIPLLNSVSILALADSILCVYMTI